MTTPDTTGDLYRVVIDGAGGKTGCVASSPRSRMAAEAGRTIATGVFAEDILAGDLTVSVISETDYRARPSRPDGGNDG